MSEALRIQEEMEKGLMNVKVNIVTVIILLVVFSMMALAAPGDPPRKGQDNGKTFELMQEIQTMNLVGGLYLSSDQVGKLLPLVKEACESEKEFTIALTSVEQSMLAVLEKMRDEIASTGSVKKETQRSYMQLERKVQQARYEAMTGKRRIAGEVKKILSENQRVLVSQYEPCIIPAQSQSNPDRIGQAGSNNMLVRVLEDGRNVAEDEYPEFKARFLDHTRRMLTLHGGMNVDEELKRHGEILDQARDMDDVEFEMKKSQLAEEFRKPTRQSGMGGLGAGSDALDRNIEMFILNKYAAASLGRLSAGGGK